MSDMKKWYIFAANNEDTRRSFQDLSLDIFCRQYEIDYGEIQEYSNQPGVEIEPVYCAKLKQYISFQSKCFDSPVKYGEVKKSINTAIEKKKGGRYPNLDKIAIFVNRRTTKDNKDKKAINALAKKEGIAIEWFDWGSIENLVKKYHELEVEYFDRQDSLGFVLDGIQRNAANLWQSGVYLDICLENKEKNQISFKEIQKKIEKEENNPILIVGNPGSGKSLLMQKLAWHLGGMDLNKADRLKKWEQTGLPAIITLHHCHYESIDSFIERQKAKFDVSNDQRLCYLLDGMDEVQPQEFMLLLDSIKRLSREGTVVLTSRTGNSNLGLLRTIFNGIDEYTIKDLTRADIDSYFNARGNPKKIELLTALNLNPEEEIKDILLLRLFYKSIEQYESVDKDFFKLELYRLAIEYLCNPVNENRILSLNVFNPKEKQIESLLTDLVATKKTQMELEFSLKEVQDFLSKKLNRATYSDINGLIAFLCDTFFESTNTRIK